MEHLQRLDWDSELFGYEIGKAELHSNDNTDLETDLADSQKFKLTYVFSDEEISYRKYKLVDKKISFTRKSGHISEDGTRAHFGIKIEKYNSRVHDSSRVEQLALVSGVFSRFYLDKNFTSREYEKLYKIWIKKSLESQISYCTLLALKDNEVVGFVTIGARKKNVSEIGLIAVDQTFRGKGVAKSLIINAVGEVYESGDSYINVSTQEDNTPAMKLYASLGFKPVSKKYIYHIWNDDTI